MKGLSYLLLVVLSLGIVSCDDKTTVTQSCGDGFVDPGEECDGSTGGETCASLGHYNVVGTLTCRADCFYDRTSCGGRCGDNQVDAEDGEACDGTHLNGNSCVLLGYHGGTLACAADCAGYDESDCEAAGRCGDGALQGEYEECEGEDLAGATCQTLGFYRGTLACAADCTYDAGGCAERCGDGVIQASEGEVCDGSNLDQETCETLGHNPGTLACDAACAFDFSGCDGRCGDGVVQAGSGEACDGANLDGETCESLGERPGTLACDTACGFDLSGCGGRCGDGAIQAGAGEQCEGTDLDGATCETLGYYGGTLACGADCRFDLLDCAGFGRCGDGLIQTTVEEDCDGTNLNGGTCESQGFYTGTLACDGTCTFDVSGCAFWCGDGILQTAYGEACDGAALGGSTCQSAWNKRWGLPGCTACELTSGTCTNTLMFGTASGELAGDVAIDGSGNIIIAGTTAASLDGQPHAGGNDLFIVKYAASGVRQWTRMLGTTGSDAANGVAIDSAGNIYVAGTTNGALDGQSNLGLEDVFLTKYDSSGTRLWTRQWGTTSNDRGYAVTVYGSDAVYVGGNTFVAMDGQPYAGGADFYVTKFNAAGVKQWTRQGGTAGGDSTDALAVDSGGNVYVSGVAQGALNGQVQVGSYDAFVCKYSSAGSLLWTVQWGCTGLDMVQGVAMDGSDNLFVTGTTQTSMDGQPNLGGFDIFLTKLTSAGARSWTRQLGTGSTEYGTNVAVDGSGNAHVVGYTSGALSGFVNLGTQDIVWFKVNTSGVTLSSTQWGSTGTDNEPRVAVDSTGHSWVAGNAQASIDGLPHAGSYDVFLTYVP